MGVALDTYDKENGIHPRNKQLVSKRLAIAGLNVAYGMLEYPTNGPFPEVWNVIPFGNGLVQVDILYDKTFIWNAIETNGFSVCCLETISDCNNRNGAWTKVHSIKNKYLNMLCSKNIIPMKYFSATNGVCIT